MRKQLFTTLLCLLITVPAWSQLKLIPDEAGIHKGMYRTTATFAPAYDGIEWKYYVLGESEYLLTDNLGLLGAVYVQAGSSEQDAANWLTDCCAYNDGQADYYAHNLFFGPKYHFLTNQPLDIYVGIQPGLTFFHTREYEYRVSETTTRIAAAHQAVEPNGSAQLGVAYYGKLFHLYGQTRYVMGRHDSEAYSLNLNDWRFSFGLGFNIF